jgi:HK97 family phage major capsid protein
MPYADAKTRSSAWAESDYLTRAAELRSEFAELSEKDRTSDEYRTGRASMLNEVDDIDHELKLVRIQQVREIRRASGQGLNPGMLDLAGLGEFRSLGEQVTEHEAFKAWMTRGGRGESPQVEIRTLVTEGTPGTPSSGIVGTLLPVGQPFLGNVQRQRLFVRDLLSVQQTGLATVPYVRELNAVTNQTTASTVAEGNVKPEGAIQFQADNAPTSIIAVNIPATTQMMEDAPTVIGYINGRLVYMIKLREEAEILNGNGVYPDLKGILQYKAAGQIQSQAATSGEYAITLGNAIAKIEVVNGMADGIAINPVDAWAMFIKRASSGAGTFDAGTPFAHGVTDTVWGLPLVRTNSLASGTAVVGAWALGATLFDRSEASVRVFEQHSDFAVKNQVLIQAEERVALAVFRPDWFVNTTLA